MAKSLKEAKGSSAIPLTPFTENGDLDVAVLEKEIEFLKELGQVAFLPVARKMGDLEPVYLEEGDPAEMTLLLQVLEKKAKRE